MGGEVWAPPCPALLRAVVTGWKENTTRRRANSSAWGRARHGPEMEKNQWHHQPWHHRGTAGSPRCWVAALGVPNPSTESIPGTKPPKPGWDGDEDGVRNGVRDGALSPAPQTRQAQHPEHRLQLYKQRVL